MGPFLIFVYYLIVESSKPSYDIVFVNHDVGHVQAGNLTNFGDILIDHFSSYASETVSYPFTVTRIKQPEEAISLLKRKDADALVIIPEEFSSIIALKQRSDSNVAVPIEISGDLTSMNYLISAVWANEIVNDYLIKETNGYKMLELTETPIGVSGSVDDFDMIVPGILIVSLIMLMFTASIAFVSEVENKTIMRLRLSRLTALEFLGGTGIVQLVIGILALLLTLITAILLGFQYQGSLITLIVIAGLTSLSIISFSLIIAAVTRSANEVLIVGNFPMFLFMFFTGAAFPIKSEALFTIAGYPISLQGLMTPVHAISALNKTLVMDMNFASIVPELSAILVLSLLYFLTGATIFYHRHLKLV
jgi:ABC-2 type transport system permease protein